MQISYYKAANGYTRYAPMDKSIGAYIPILIVNRHKWVAEQCDNTFGYPLGGVWGE